MWKISDFLPLLLKKFAATRFSLDRRGSEHQWNKSYSARRVKHMTSMQTCRCASHCNTAATIFEYVKVEIAMCQDLLLAWCLLRIILYFYFYCCPSGFAGLFSFLRFKAVHLFLRLTQRCRDHLPESQSAPRTHSKVKENIHAGVVLHRPQAAIQFAVFAILSEFRL